MRGVKARAVRSIMGLLCRTWKRTRGEDIMAGRRAKMMTRKAAKRVVAGGIDGMKRALRHAAITRTKVDAPSGS